MSQRTIVVTGVSRGLGRAMVKEFQAAGHTVIGCARNASSVAELNAQYGAPHSFLAVDVDDANAVQTWAESVVAQFGPPDLLINNAAIINANARLWEVPVDEFARVLHTNVNGVYHVLRAFLPAMVARGSGVIVNFSSTWGRSADALVAPYCATKWAIEGLTRGLAKELPSGMAAVAFNPGIIDTEMLRSCFGEESNRFPSPEEWARAASQRLLSLQRDHNGQSIDAPRH